MKKNISNETLFFRRSIFAKKNLVKGSKINNNNILVLRPNIGIGAENFFKIIGKKINKDIKKNSPIFIKDIK